MEIREIQFEKLCGEIGIRTEAILCGKPRAEKVRLEIELNPKELTATIEEIVFHKLDYEDCR